MDSDNNPLESLKKIKVAFISNFTVQQIGGFVKKRCESEAIIPETYIAPYDQVNQELLNPESGLYRFEPEIVFLLLDGEKLFGDAYRFPYTKSFEEFKALFHQRLEELKNLVKVLKKNSSAKIVINEILLPIETSVGILETKQDEGIYELVIQVNRELKEFAKGDNQLFIFDTNRTCMKIGYNEFFDERFSYLGDMKISVKGLEFLAEEYMAYLIPIALKTKKCLVLDLDNTLWGGVVGEEGIKGIKLGPDKAGKPFMDFQKKLLELFNKGIILAINSKNNTEDALEVIRSHEYMVLRENNFACMKINWQDKVTNMKEIASELNIGIDSLVFVDDDKTNRALVKEMLPRVSVLDLPEEPAEYLGFLERVKLFNTFTLTDEDKLRGKMYVEQRNREEARLSSTDLDSFIQSLNIEWELRDVEEGDIARAAQLTQKTNQFNLTVRRYTDENIRTFLSSENYLLKLLKVKDRFGDYGLTGLVIMKKLDENSWEIDTFLLSCRILGKKIEFSAMNRLIEELVAKGAKTIYATFLHAPKNLPAKEFLKESGFALYKQAEDVDYYKLEK